MSERFVDWTNIPTAMDATVFILVRTPLNPILLCAAFHIASILSSRRNA